MFRILRLALLLTVGFAVGIVAGLAIGRRQSSPLALLFSNPDGSQCQMPCLLGIRPGQTSLNEAVALLNAHPFMKAAHAHYDPSQDMEGSTHTFTSPSMTLILAIANGVDTTITDVTLHFADTSLIPATAADVVAVLGPPRGIQAATIYTLWFDTTITALFEPTGLAMDPRPIQQGDQTISLWIHTPMTKIAAQPWCGFTLHGCPGNPLGGVIRYPYP